MTRVTQAFVSDDKFDMVGNMDSVSGLASRHESQPPSPMAAAPRVATILDAQTEAPPVSSHGNELVAGIAANSLDDSHVGADGHDKDDKSRSRLDDIPGMKYSRSMFNKLFGEKDALIAVMGMTGSGKTTFISTVTGRKDLEIGHDLTSCTRDIQVVETRIDGQTVHFIDTPGFSDTALSDSEVLEMIADYLAAAYQQQLKLTGIIYLHPISDTRMTHHGTKNLEMFRKLTGEKNLKNVVLATSMWDKVTAADGDRRESELCSRFWKIFIALEARTTRHDGSVASARAIAGNLLANRPFYLQLQEEMGKDKKPLRDTAAGQEVMLAIERIKEEHDRELAQLNRLLRDSAEQSQSVVEALKESFKEQERVLQSALHDEKRMKEDSIRSMMERIGELEGRPRCLVM